MDPKFLDAHVRSIWPEFNSQILRGHIERLLERGFLVVAYKFHLDRTILDPSRDTPCALSVTRNHKEAAILTWLAYTFSKGNLSDFMQATEDNPMIGVLNPESSGNYMWGACVIQPLSTDD